MLLLSCCLCELFHIEMHNLRPTYKRVWCCRYKKKKRKMMNMLTLGIYSLHICRSEKKKSIMSFALKKGPRSKNKSVLVHLYYLYDRRCDAVNHGHYYTENIDWPFFYTSPRVILDLHCNRVELNVKCFSIRCYV